MPRYHEDPAHARYLTFGCFRRKHLFRIEGIPQLFINHLSSWRRETGVELWAYVIMPNHVHLLLRFQGDSLRRELHQLKGRFAKDALERMRTLSPAHIEGLAVTDHGQVMNRFWQAGGGYDRNLYSDEAVLKTIEYIHSNPVNAGIVSKPEDYRHSSAKYWLRNESGPLELDRPDWL